MENLPRDLEKITELKDLSHASKRHTHWNLLFIDDQGKVISFQHIRWVVILFILVLLILLAGSTCLYFVHKNTKDKINELHNSLDLSRQDVKTLQEKIHDLMVQLAQAQSSLPKEYAKKAVKKPSSRKKPVLSAVQLAKAGTARTRKAEPSKPKTSRKRQAESSSAVQSSKTSPRKGKNENSKTQSVQPKKKAVDVFDFSASYSSSLNILKTKFVIKNASLNAPHIAGYLFIIIKENDHDQKGWLTIPPVSLVSGKPSRIKSGQYFKIRNYKTVEFKSEKIIGPKKFKKATIFIYSPKNELLLEKTYRTNIKVAEPPSPKIEISPPATTETGEGLQEQKKNVKEIESIAQEETHKKNAGADAASTDTEIKNVNKENQTEI